MKSVEIIVLMLLEIYLQIDQHLTEMSQSSLEGQEVANDDSCNPVMTATAQDRIKSSKS